MSESKAILALIADLAKATAEWQGGSNMGCAYTSFDWRKKLGDIATRAERLAHQPDLNSENL